MTSLTKKMRTKKKMLKNIKNEIFQSHVYCSHYTHSFCVDASVFRIFCTKLLRFGLIKKEKQI